MQFGLNYKGLRPFLAVDVLRAMQPLTLIGTPRGAFHRAVRLSLHAQHRPEVGLL